MTNDSNTRWIAALALAISAGALGVSLATGCKSAPEDVTPRTETRTPPAGERTVKTTRTDAPKTDKEREASGISQPPTSAKNEAASEAATIDASDTSNLTVKRLVVARNIEQREPVTADSLVVGSPIFAFVELENEGDADSAVVITFEQEGASVGHVELKVPADSPRWRTWGNTRNISKAGHWTAVVRTKDGRELGRQTFEVGTV